MNSGRGCAVILGKNGRVVIQTSHTPAHDVTATVAPFRAWRDLQLIIARGPERTTIARAAHYRKAGSDSQGLFPHLYQYIGIEAPGNNGRNLTDTDWDQVPRPTTIVECNCPWITPSESGLLRCRHERNVICAAN